LPDHHRIDVTVTDDPAPHVSIRGTWVHAPTGRMIPIRPIQVPIDATKMAPVGGVLMMLIWVAYGRIASLNLEEGKRAISGSGIVSRPHRDRVAVAASSAMGRDESARP
jgi:hypothetical protein